ncbi:MAG: flagellar biosynthetic protein FlhB [Candidatus Marinamargulisbacteria bacterium]|jgi:flagellar biosynthetic protein FlhB
MGEDSGEKTEEPTPHKLREARKKGQIAKSKDVTSSVLVIVSFFTLKATAADIWEQLVRLSYEVYDYIPAEFSVPVVGLLLRTVLGVVFRCLLPLFLMNMAVAIIIESMQTGFLLSLEPIMPKLEKLNPIEGAKKFFSLKQYVELFKSVIKMAAVIGLILITIRQEFFMVVIAQQLSLWQLMAFAGSIVMKVVVRVGILYVIIALLDYLYQRYEYIKGMKMSKKEIKDEYKRLEGDPMIKQRQREAQRQMSQGRQMGAVPSADVVVTNPVHLAMAIQYKTNQMRAPTVVAKGKRIVAQEIKRIAEENMIPIVENPPLTRELYKIVEVGAEVPPHYYKAVAEILAFVYNLKKKRRVG